MKSLRLDIDGVFIRDKELLEHVQHNCVQYVRTKLPDCKDPVKTNNTLYLVHGHTARGLQVGYEVNVNDFNSKVYDKNLLHHLGYVLSTQQVQDEAAQIHELTRQGWNVTLFTNAPWVWAHKVALAIGDNIIIKCPGSPSESPLKPEVGAYIFPFEHTNVMVDDSLKNLGTARYLTNWKCIHFNEGPKDNNLWCPQVNSISEMCSLLRSSY
jgi:FMN phosphatase YigB (HAD superfamily)